MSSHALIPLIPVLLLTAAVPAKGGVQSPIKVLVFTGGHGFEEAPFFSLFEGYADLDATRAVQPAANQMFANGEAMKHDVIVLYDMWQPISEAEKRGFAEYLKAGKGLVALHHCIASYQEWDGFLDILGGRYVLGEGPVEIDGAPREPSSYKHDVTMDVEIADPNHPIARGISDFSILDETYGNVYIRPTVHALLKTGHPTSNPVIGWTNDYENARVAYLQLGHDSHAFNHPDYRRLVVQAIRWAADRPSPRRLFNGKDLTGWVQEGKSVWTVKDGILTGKQGPNLEPGDLFFGETFGDFELTVEFKVDWPANSGVWFRYRKPEQALQADILEWKDPVCWTGSLYCSGKMFIAMNEDPGIVNKEGWNTFAIRCEGKRARVWLNGHLTADVEEDSSLSGRIGFQIHAGDEFKDMAIHVRNAEILELD